jgi:hypothetical protein
VRRLAVALVVAFAIPATAHAAAPAAEVRDSNGAILSSDPGRRRVHVARRLRLLLTIGSSRRDATGLTLNDVSILGGGSVLAG